MKKKQAEQFNKMRRTLERISKHYMTPAQIRRDADKGNMGIDYEEYLEMAYENIQSEAKQAIKGVRLIEENKPTQS